MKRELSEHHVAVMTDVALTSVKGNVGMGCEKQDQARRASHCDAPSKLQADPQEHWSNDCPRPEFCWAWMSLPPQTNFLQQGSTSYHSQTAVNWGPPFQTQGPMGTHFAFKPQQQL